MSICRRFVVCTLPMVLLVMASLARGQAAPATDPAELWADFNHYVRIARPDLAKAAGAVLLRQDVQKLLDVVEASSYRDTYLATLERAARTEGLKDVGEQLARRIQEARIARSREPQRILNDIEKLAGSERERLNALERLRAAGQFAAPQLLNVLLDEKQTSRHPYVLNAMTAIGRPLVYPLSVALPQLDPRPQTQVAQALAEIGYPRALPYLKRALENPKTDAAARKTVQVAYDKLLQGAGIPSAASAADLFLVLARNCYSSQTRGQEVPGFDAATGKGIIWQYRPTVGLIAVPVPGAIHGDVLAMRAAEAALELSPQMDPALSVWLLANLRRAARLPAGEQDPSYPAALQPPPYYLRAAGPARQHDVLAKALDDGDATLALAAIDALAETAGTDRLVPQAGPQPLIHALYYPDRRVRIRAALALANARPDKAFTGSDRVVRVLAEAVRASDSRHALVLSNDQEALNQLTAAAKELGYQPIAGKDLAEVNAQIGAGPGVDLILVKAPAEAFADLYAKIAGDYRLATLPVVAVAQGRDQTEINRRYAAQTRQPAISGGARAAELKPAIEQAGKFAGDVGFAPDQAQHVALAAIAQLRDVAVGAGKVYNVAEAQGALVAALGDSRAEVVRAAGGVLALIKSPEAQRSLADAALDAGRPADLRVELMDDLSDSATAFGNHLTAAQLAKVQAMVKAAQAPTAAAASRLYGALSLPSADVVQVIAGGK